MKQLALITLAMFIVASPATGIVSDSFQVQGVLTDDAGVPLPDDEYSAMIKLYDAPTGGLSYWSSTTEVFQVDGVFTALLEGFYPETFERDLWLEITMEGEAPMTPRIPLYPVPVAISASRVDPSAAVTELNGKNGPVTLVAGTNVTIGTSGTTSEITISATPGAGGDDGDWVINGDDVTHAAGRVFVGGSLAKALPADGEFGEKSASWPLASKMEVQGLNEGFSSYMEEDNALNDGRSSIFGMRRTTVRNHGTAVGANYSNAAITGYNYYGESYTWAISGFTNFNYRNTGAVLGSNASGQTWAALAFMDNDVNYWGLYTPSNIHTDGLTETGTFRMTNGASLGYILTSDATGQATWSPPAAVQSDGDWTVSGGNVYRSGTGVAALGTSVPHSWGDSSTATTMQIKALFAPTLALDAQGIYPNNQLHRWTMTGGTSGLQFNKTSDFASYGTTAMLLTESKVEINDLNGDRKITLQTYDPSEAGGVIRLYGNNTPNPTLTLDGQLGNDGGQIIVHDGSGNAEVTITSSYQNSGVGRVVTPVLEITGGSDLSEQFDIGNTSALTKPGMVVSIDPDNPGQLALSGEAYDRKVAGVISGAGGVNTGMVMGQRGTVADGELPVALVGRVYVWADASDAPIEPGDLLTTSDRPGHAMKVSDHVQATGAILGKAMTGLAEGQGLILTLVTLQ